MGPLPKTYIDQGFPSTPTFLYLRRLDLSSSFHGDRGAFELAESSAFRYLEYLKAKNCQIGNQGFADLVASPNLRRLKVLILAKNSISKLVFPFDDLRLATPVQRTREVMSLDLLDLRENQLTSVKSNSKFLSDTVVLAWGNPMTERAIDGAI